jgi:SAM-dependent methyltransferase
LLLNTYWKKRFRKLSNLDYLSADLNPELAMSKQDITDIQFPDNSFDMIICSHVLMHVPEEEKAINELYRVLKKGETTLLMTKIDFKRNTTYEVTGVYAAEDRLKTYGDDEIFRVHGTDFAERVRNAGFIVEEVDYTVLLGKQYEKFGLGTGEIIFKCTKAA